MGKFYTIQQFKKAEGVVYETARTSMDNLAKRGYYRREQVKNKFVYTPISKK
jgi:predicted transcriptional regulator